MVGQQAYGWHIAWDDHNVLAPITVQVKNKKVFAEVALSGHQHTWKQQDDYHLWLSLYVGITQVVSDSGVEAWGPIDQGVYRQAVLRSGVTSVTVQLAGETSQGGSTGHGFARGRLFIDYWE
jgi:hypothetical protein